MPNVERSLVRVEPEDLRRMADTALARLNQLFDERPDNSGRFRDSLLMLCLAQGGGLHYVDGVNGLKDIDIIVFLNRLPGAHWHPQNRWEVDYGESKFGRDPNESLHFKGRRMDIMGRVIDRREGEDAVAAVQRYIASGRPKSSPGHWRQKPGVAIWPEVLRGQVIWRPA